MTPRLAVEGVAHAYGRSAVLDAVSLTVEPGEILCILGPSGCGKTTLLRLIAGLEALQAGRIAIDGRAVAGAGGGLPPERRGVGMMFQDFALFPHLSVSDNVAFGLAGAATARRAAALALLERVGMRAHAQAFPHQLSGGQQQRVALARALAPQPRLLLLDEPFSGLDARLRGRLRDDTLRLLKEGGVAALMVTHDPEEAMLMADRIALMRRGRIVQCGRPAELYRQPASAFAAEFFGEVNRLPAIVAGGAVATPFGPLPAAGLCEGGRAAVLIRPEALSLLPCGAADGVPARILAARPLGCGALVELELADGAAGARRLRARVADDEAAAGRCCALRLDRRLAYVFPADEAAGEA